MGIVNYENIFINMKKLFSEFLFFQAPCDCKTSQKCNWIFLKSTFSNKVTLSVPTGNYESQTIIFVVTFFVVFLCILAIVINSIFDKKGKID